MTFDLSAGFWVERSLFDFDFDFDFDVSVLRWNWRFAFYASALGTDQYPPVRFSAGGDPADLQIACPEHLLRGCLR